LIENVSVASGIGVFYLARGADDDAPAKFQRFRESYRQWESGVEHVLYVIFKGFANASALTAAREIFRRLEYHAIYLDDDGFDLGSYFAAAARTQCETVCFFNTSSEIRGPDWLHKLAGNLAQSGVGLVGCSGSYEAPQHLGTTNAAFPNPHVRSNAFMMRRSAFLKLRPGTPLLNKLDMHLFEHGPASMTRRLAAEGLRSIVVGKNGRGYEIRSWPRSQTFRQGAQANLLVWDNRARDYEKAPIAEKRVLFQVAWGDGSFGRVDAISGEHSNRTGRTCTAANDAEGTSTVERGPSRLRWQVPEDVR
jgi:hypothetical protein